MWLNSETLSCKERPTGQVFVLGNVVGNRLEEYLYTHFVEVVKKMFRLGFVLRNA